MNRTQALTALAVLAPDHLAVAQAAWSQLVKEEARARSEFALRRASVQERLRTLDYLSHLQLIDGSLLHVTSFGPDESYEALPVNDEPVRRASFNSISGRTTLFLWDGAESHFFRLDREDLVHAREVALAFVLHGSYPAWREEYYT